MNHDLKKLNEAEDLTVTPGDPDPRGWQVTSLDGADIGRVSDLIVDEHDMRARYLDIEFDQALVRTPGRHLFVPTEAVSIGDDERRDQRLAIPVRREAVLAAPHPVSVLIRGGPESTEWPSTGNSPCRVRVTRGEDRD